MTLTGVRFGDGDVVWLAETPENVRRLVRWAHRGRRPLWLRTRPLVRINAGAKIETFMESMDVDLDMGAVVLVVPRPVRVRQSRHGLWRVVPS
jgi:hypothetical protein